MTIKFRCKKCGQRFRYQNHEDFYEKVMSCDDRGCPQMAMNLSWAKEPSKENEGKEETQELVLKSPPAIIDYVDRRYIRE
jgi:hypothetical protein